MSKPGLPPGTRDFSADTVRKRNYILNTIRQVFELYGFQPLETPAIENLETLMGKYGEEGDKLIFRILNNGIADTKNVEKTRKAFEQVMEGKNDRDLTERALRYDLTIPFARYVAMNHGQLTFPFKRYQIQPVWRADRPQKGRYREFWQCDADVVGSKSLLNEAEFVQIYDLVFKRLGLDGYELRINSRNILVAIAHACGGREMLTSITTAIDKLDKIGLEKVQEELISRSLSHAQVELITQYLQIGGNNVSSLTSLKTLLANASAESRDFAEQGLSQLQTVLDLVKPEIHGLPLVIDFTLARGLSYYTGTIFEARAPSSVQIGSIGGGGRYDDLTGLFGVSDVPGVGISFGVDRIYDVMEELKAFPATLQISTQVLFLNLGEAASEAAFNLLGQLRATAVRGELYPEHQKIDRQFKYAEKKKIPFVVTVGDEELKNRLARIKDIRSGTSITVSWEELILHDFSSQ
ncbi:MAG TPA: histidine--tRNA ligase [Flavitalea sp.]|nr:histidine--tRNA ligase [Flavitalea sp.]